jgi:XTP/dITP diphosphohydrolase
MDTLVIATGNLHKLREFAELLKPLGVSVKGQSEYGVSSVEETEDTFVGNAMLKARHAARLTQHWALADDSGLVVDALNGAPGVFSARFAGLQATDAQNNQLLLDHLRGHPKPWTARYVACLVLVSPEESVEPIIAQADWVGIITDVAGGSNGFGYDPYFIPHGETRTAAQLSDLEKNNQSHRGKALAELLRLWPRVV